MITGGTAAELAESVRWLVDRGELAPGDALPPVRELAQAVGVNRNTVVSAYRLLVRAGVAVTRGRLGTSIAKTSRSTEEGFAAATGLRDVADGNPDATRLPDVAGAIRRLPPAPTSLYGTPVLDPALASWAVTWLSQDQPRELAITLTHGAVDAVERLLAQSLTQGDAVALEDPCFLASIHTARLAGYRTVAVPVDDKGMTVDGLRAALAHGIRAIVCTPRAHNPTGASLTPARAAALRDVLADHPYVLVVEDDHFSMLSTAAYATIVPPTHERWALVRSVSKALGPDLRLAVVGSDPVTAGRLAERLSPGTTWVSHLLQRAAHQMLTDVDVQRSIAAASRHYAHRNAAFVERLADHGLWATAADGLNVWVEVGDAARSAAALADAGWLVRPGAEFALDGGDDTHLRLTVHRLDDAAAEALAGDLATR